MKPSKGAVRAAKLIACSGSLRPLVFGAILREQAAAPWAEIIERSTHAGEMAELLHQLRSCDPPKEMQWAKDYAERLLAELERES